MQVLAEKSTGTITKISNHIGAEVIGLDLRQPIDAETRRRLNKALVENVALVIRDQHFTPQQYLDAVALFGEPMVQDNSEYGVPDVPLVKLVSNCNKTADGRVAKLDSRWHTDHTNRECPPKFTSLYAVELPDAGGATSVVNMRAGYQSLPDDIRNKIDGMKTANVRLGSGVKKEHRYSLTSQQAQNELKPTPVVHPLVRTNPDTGSKAIYCHPNKMENILGLSPTESQDFMADLIKTAIRPEFIYKHQWRIGDMLIWDNRSSMHMAHFDFDPNQYRTLYRVIVKGERPH